MTTGRRQTRKWLLILPVIAVFVIGAAILGLLRLVGRPAAPFPQIIGHNCGYVYDGFGIPEGVYDPDQGELCLWRAYTSCRTSTLVASFMGVDAGHTDAITVQPKAGRCAVTDVMQGYGEGLFGMTTSSSTFQCAGVQQQDGGVLIRSCGSYGDLYLRPRPPEQAGHVCGVILSQNYTNYTVSSEVPDTQDTVAKMEDCFWQAYTTCARPATLIYTNVIISNDDTLDYSQIEHTLVVQPSHGSCTLTDVIPTSQQSGVKYTCASLTRDTDGGLVARGCGAEGDIIIPPATSPNK